MLCSTGRYESPPSSYKHVYFNSTAGTARIWLLIVLGVLILYECLRYLVPLVFQRKARWSMMALFLSALYPHYYGWWNFISYVNEDFYSQWNHQWFFSLTEGMSTTCVILLCNVDNRLEPWKLLTIMSINVMHILVNCLDQFINNVFLRNGQQFEVFRDIGLLLPDVFHVLVAFFEMGAVADRREISVLKLFHREELLMAVVFVGLLTVLGRSL
jgi:hypothetical protein